MLHTITKRLEIYIDNNIEISKVDTYTWIFTSRIFRLALELTFLLNKYFFLQMANELLLQSRKRNKHGGGGEGGEGFFEKNERWEGALIRNPRIITKSNGK